MQEAKPREPRQTHEPVEQSVYVDCAVEEAFELFTGRLEEWWPAAEAPELGLDNILEWDPPHRVKYAWPGHHQTVDVRFLEDAGGTRVTITHEGWQRAAVPACAARFSAFACEQLLVLA